jgi:hypothetical protein
MFHFTPPIFFSDERNFPAIPVEIVEIISLPSTAASKILGNRFPNSM